MEITYVNGNLWPIDTVCLECHKAIRLQSSEDFTAIPPSGDATHYSYKCPHCGGIHSVPKTRIPEKVLKELKTL